MIDRRISLCHIRAQVVRELLIKIRDQIDLLQEPPMGADFTREARSSGIRAMQRGVIVVDKVAEQSVLDRKSVV